MVEVIKTMVTSFKMYCACIASLSAPDPAAGHHRPTPPMETLGHSQAILGQSLVGSWLLSPGSWCTQGFVCALKESISLGVLSPFAGSPGSEICCGPRTFATVIACMHLFTCHVCAGELRSLEASGFLDTMTT